MLAFHRLSVCLLPLISAPRVLADLAQHKPLSKAQLRQFHPKMAAAPAPEPAALVDWAQASLGALFPASTAPKEDLQDGQDWFSNAFARAFAPDAELTIATASSMQPMSQDDGEGEHEESFADLEPGEGNDVKHVSGADAIAALRDLASGGPKLEFDSVRQTAGDDQSGTVEGNMLLTRNLRFRIRAAPAQTLTTVKFTADISGTPRLITQYSHTAETHRKPTHFAHMPAGVRQSVPNQRVLSEES